MKQRIPVKELLPLLGLTVSAFVFNTSEFMPIGLLTDIAASFHLTEASAGIMITVYSWAVMLLSLPLMLLVSKLDFRKLLLGTIGLFSAGQILSAAAPSYGILILSRLAVACAHAIFWSIASPLAVRVVSEKYRSFALSMIVTGTSMAMILGMPLGRMIGLCLGWRMTFVCVAAVSLLAAVYLCFVFPKVPASEPFTLGQLPGLFKSRLLVSIYVLIFLFAGSYYIGYSYIEPFLSQVAGLSANAVTIALTVFGAAGLLGSFLFSRCYDRFRYPFIIFFAGCVSAALLLLYPASMNHYTTIALCAFWGMSVTAFNVTFQSELIRCTSEEASAVAMSIFSGIYNLGIGCGTGIGGLVCTHISIQWIGIAGGLIAAAAAIYCVLRVIRLMKAEDAPRH